jgi:hypothetical protein
MSAVEPIKPLWIKFSLASKISGLSTIRLEQLQRTGELLVSQLGPKTRLVNVESLDACIRRYIKVGKRTFEPGPPPGCMQLVKEFVDQHCIMAPYRRETARALYDKFQETLGAGLWVGKRDFGQALRLLGYKPTRGAQGRRFWCGLTLASSIDRGAPL